MASPISANCRISSRRRSTSRFETPKTALLMYTFSRPVRIGLKPAPRAIKPPTRPRIVIRPSSGLMSPFSIFKSVLLPEPFGPIRPTHSPRRTWRSMSCNAQNSPGRRFRCGSLRPSSSVPISRTPYHMACLRLRQNFLETCETSIKHSSGIGRRLLTEGRGAARLSSEKGASRRSCEPRDAAWLFGTEPGRAKIRSGTGR